MYFSSDQLKELRNNQNLTQHELAGILGIKRSTLAAWEAGSGVRKLKDAIQISGIFNIPLSVHGTGTIPVQSSFDPAYVGLSSESYYGIPYLPSLDKFTDGEGRLIRPSLQTSKIPASYTHIPDLKADMVIEVFSENMSPRYIPGQRIAIEEVEMDMVLYGFAYLIVFSNGQKHIMYIRKGSNPDLWLLENENSKFDSREMTRDKIRQLFIVKGYVRIEIMS